MRPRKAGFFGGALAKSIATLLARAVSSLSRFLSAWARKCAADILAYSAGMSAAKASLRSADSSDEATPTARLASLACTTGPPLSVGGIFTAVGARRVVGAAIDGGTLRLCGCV